MIEIEHSKKIEFGHNQHGLSTRKIVGRILYRGAVADQTSFDVAAMIGQLEVPTPPYGWTQQSPVVTVDSKARRIDYEIFQIEVTVKSG